MSAISRRNVQKSTELKTRDGKVLALLRSAVVFVVCPMVVVVFLLEWGSTRGNKMERASE